MTRIKTRLLSYLLLSICLTGCYDNAFNDTENASNQNNGNNNSNHAYDPPTAFAGESCNPQTFKEFCYDGVAMMCDFYQERVVGIDCRETGVLTCHSRRTDNYSTCTVGCYNYGEIIRTCSSTDSRVLLSKCDYGIDNKLYLFDDGYESCMDGEVCQNGKCQAAGNPIGGGTEEPKINYINIRLDNISTDNAYIDAICLKRADGKFECMDDIISSNGNSNQIKVHFPYSMAGIPDMVNYNSGMTPNDLIGLSCYPQSNSSSTCISNKCMNPHVGCSVETNDYECCHRSYGIMEPGGYIIWRTDTPIRTGDTLYVYSFGFQQSSSCNNGYSCIYGMPSTLLNLEVQISEDAETWEWLWRMQGYIDTFPSFTFNIP